MDLYTLLMPPLVIGSSIWVYFDARAIGGEYVNNVAVFGDITPGLWSIGCLLMWLVVFPTYLFKRGEIKRRVKEYRDQPDEYKFY